MKNKEVKVSSIVLKKINGIAKRAIRVNNDLKISGYSTASGPQLAKALIMIQKICLRNIL